MNIKIGIFQGRLTKSNKLQSFPKNWKDEYFKAKILNFSHIEFFLEERKNYDNPFWHKKGRKEIHNLTQQSFTNQTFFLCDNFIIKNNIYESKTKNYLKKVLKNLNQFKKSKLILPLHASYFDDPEKLANYMKNILKKIDKKIVISFETDAEVEKNIKFIEILNLKKVGFTFDIGNIFLKNKNPEIYLSKIYKYVNHIHIKDRSKNGNNVKLGQGLINFKTFFKLLKKLSLNCTITFETYRKNTPIISGYENLNLINKIL